MDVRKKRLYETSLAWSLATSDEPELELNFIAELTFIARLEVRLGKDPFSSQLRHIPGGTGLADRNVRSAVGLSIRRRHGPVKTYSRDSDSAAFKLGSVWFLNGANHFVFSHLWLLPIQSIKGSN